MSQEVQFAEVSVRVALLVDTDQPNNSRMEATKHHVKNRLESGGSFEFRSFTGPVTLHETETMEERAHRLEGEAEARAEAKLERQLERYYDRNGHF
jgi:hypothetical protein